MKPDVAKMTALLGLKKLSPKLRSDVLSDGSIAARYKLNVHRPFLLADDVIVSRDLLFSIFANLADGRDPGTLIDLKGVNVDAVISLSAEHDALVQLRTRRIRFPHAGLLVSDVRRRTSLAQARLQRLTVAEEHRRTLFELVSKPDLSYEEFLAALAILESSVESFSRQLNEKVSSRQLNESDLLPDDNRYWDNLTAPAGDARTLNDFVAGALAAERSTRWAEGSAAALKSISLSFSAPALVPLRLLSQTEVTQLIEGLNALLDLDDHFALVGAFEICADNVERDHRFLALGERFLDRLLGDLTALRRRCAMFTAAFVVGLSWLAVREDSRDAPAFWRRLAAASHAQNVVRTCGLSDIDHEELVRWAMQLRGFEYFLSVLRDMPALPRWRPEWVDPGFLIADAVGRVNNALTKLGAATPASWKERVTRATGVLDEEGRTAAMNFPAVQEGERLAQPQTLTELPEALGTFYRAFRDEPTIDSLLRLTYVVHSFGYPEELNETVKGVVADIGGGKATAAPREVEATITLASHIAVATRDVQLADLISNVCAEDARDFTDPQALTEMFFRLVECSGANIDRAAADVALTQRLTQVAFSVPGPAIATQLLELLDKFGRVAPELHGLLARALHVARIAAHGAASKQG
jgi:hypothetical protein